ncbi:MAG: TIGR00266 family protein [Salinispira sp.]
MKYEIFHRPSYAMLKLNLPDAESVIAEAGAMVAMNTAMTIKTHARGGVLKSMSRSLLGGESFFVNTFTSNGDGELVLAPRLPGDIIARELNGQTLFVQSGSFIAATPDVEIDTKWGGTKGFFSTKNFFLLRCSGNGTIFLSSYGAIEEVTLAAGQRYVVDTAHTVAFDESVQYAIKSSGKIKTLLFSGEGLICEYTGPGQIYYQSRDITALANIIGPMVAQK